MLICILFLLLVKNNPVKILLQHREKSKKNYDCRQNLWKHAYFHFKQRHVCVSYMNLGVCSGRLLHVELNHSRLRVWLFHISKRAQGLLPIFTANNRVEKRLTFSLDGNCHLVFSNVYFYHNVIEKKYFC